MKIARPALLPLLLFTTLLGACAGGISRLVPPGGKMVAEINGETARLRVYTMPPGQTPALSGVLLVYVELTNRGTRSLRVSYPDMWMGDRPGPRVEPLRPGDVLRPASLPNGQRRLLASVMPGTLFGRRSSMEPPPRPDTLSDWETGLDVFAPTARRQANNHWILRNDMDKGMQLSTAGWNYFGLPRPGTAMSLFDLLASTLPDGAILPGATVAGFLFFPQSVKGLAERGLRWDVHEAVSDEAVEMLSLPLHLQ